jgi:hypothetical protein
LNQSEGCFDELISDQSNEGEMFSASIRGQVCKECGVKLGLVIWVGSALMRVLFFDHG